MMRCFLFGDFLDVVHLFNEGGHPAMLTNLTEFYELSMEFLKMNIIYGG